MPTENFRQLLLHDIVRTYRNYKTLGERAIAQISDGDLHTVIDSESNTIAVIMKHVAGNLRSRFTDFLTTDGEKPNRDRDSEFAMTAIASREEILQWWESSWTIALDAIEALTPEDLDRKVYIRGEEFFVIEALNRLATHAAYHVGQIVFLAKHRSGPRWTSLSIPKNRSAEAKGEYKKGLAPDQR